jgi:hypothetical protein
MRSGRWQGLAERRKCRRRREESKAKAAIGRNRQVELASQSTFPRADRRFANRLGESSVNSLEPDSGPFWLGFFLIGQFPDELTAAMKNCTTVT